MRAYLLGLVVLTFPASAMVETEGGATLSKDEVAAVVNTISKQQEQIKALEKRLTTCFNNT